MVEKVMIEAFKQAADFFAKGMKPAEMAKGAKVVVEVAEKLVVKAAKNLK